MRPIPARLAAFSLAAALFLAAALPLSSASAVTGQPEVSAPSVVLMEKTTGDVLYEDRSHEQYEPASVTKIMTLLLTFEALEDGLLTLDQTVTASAHAASMGGSQIWLEVGEQLTVAELIKAVAVVSANDCAVALAEAIAGSETAFVARMNERAAQLGMEQTTFQNCTGLPAEGHLTTAYDIALMSRELILHHPEVREYTTLWTDTLRDGASALTNTNKLVRSYSGATGLKTGYTDSALYCLSATAERDGMELIAVVMHAQTSAQRFESAAALLDYGFANFTLLTVSPAEALPPVDVTLGVSGTVQPVLSQESAVLLERAQVSAVQQSVTLAPSVEAPVTEGDVLGTLSLTVDGQEVASVPLVAGQSVDRLSLGGVFLRLLAALFPSG